MDSDSNLLYGLLARLFDFVPLAELHSALQASLVAPPRPLAQILGERALLAAEQRAALDGLLRAYLALHEGDPARGLAALARSRAMKSALDGLLRPPAAPEVDANLTLPQASTTLLAESSYVEAGDDLGPASERFRILRTHAKGGLGEVFVAHDEELRREVALKRLHDHHADAPDTRARFVLEAEVTGGLEHPGIVPVYSLGRSAEGRPYYAMRLIRGDSLKQAIDHYHQAELPGPDPGEHALELRKLLGRFIDVCNAVEYAHSRGVIHRDLKPDNIMLGMFGETLVVDWGLAKHLGSATLDDSAAGSPLQAAGGADTARTQVGSAVGTPAYMSPEQAAGRLDQLGAPSDIYSLGATLYYLLTGRPPFEEPGLLKLLLRVQDGDFPLPREVKASVPAALQAICLKAMALAPGQRYPSCMALAEDLERWLADEPVGAHRAPWPERVARWGRRHRRSVEAAAAALAAITLISIVAFVLVHGAKQEVERERDEVRQALAAETAAKRQAHAALEAEREAKREARLAIDDYVKLVSENHALKDEQVQPLRRRMLEDARRSYRQLLDKNGRDAHARQDLASAILRIGRINNASGSKQEAIEAFQEARTA
ncbi:MAG TPA: serine/threonine-protein kinase, partial [Pirellulales bacterium]|nr:serine/threonine-protein kinase [Pirellulales bacterium]